jgi:hypothetical protein
MGSPRRRAVFERRRGDEGSNVRTCRNSAVGFGWVIDGVEDALKKERVA